MHFLQIFNFLHHDPFQEEEKAQLMQETGLELKQVNNWFINQRKRNWQGGHNSNSFNGRNKVVKQK